MPQTRSHALCPENLLLRSLSGIPIARPGDDPAAMILDAMSRAGLRFEAGDVLVVSSKFLSRAEGRFVDLSGVEASEAAISLAARVGKEPEVVEVILRESQSVSKEAPGVLIVRHKLGFIAANAGIDQSNASPPSAPTGSGPWVLLLPTSPDESARALRAAFEAASKVHVGVIVSDSFGRPFREGSLGVALGLSGLPAIWDQRGRQDLFGRVLEHTVTALADQIATAAELLAGQANEGRPAVLVRGLQIEPTEGSSARDLDRPPSKDLYA